MKITYHGHACFTVESAGYQIVLDPFKGVRGMADTSLKANEVICSHEHFDHNFREGVEITKAESPFEVKTLHVFHDDKEGALRGKNDITVMTAEGKTVVHMGDIGHFLTDEQIAFLGNVDVLLIPVGGFFTIDAKQAAAIVKSIAPKMIVPMHFRDGDIGLEPVGTVEEFIKLLDEADAAKLRLVKGYEDTLEI